MPLLFGYDVTHDDGEEAATADLDASSSRRGPGFLGLSIERFNMQVPRAYSAVARCCVTSSIRTRCLLHVLQLKLLYSLPCTCIMPSHCIHQLCNCLHHHADVDVLTAMARSVDRRHAITTQDLLRGRWVGLRATLAPQKTLWQQRRCRRAAQATMCAEVSIAIADSPANNLSLSCNPSAAS